MKRTIRKTTATLLLLLASGLSACGPVNKTIRPSADDMNHISRLAVLVPAEGDFTVFDERTKATVAPVIMFGLIGAAVASAHNNHLDQEKATALSKGLEGLSCRSRFLDSFMKTLKENGRFKEVTLLALDAQPKEIALYDAVATLKIDQWGIRLAERSQGDLMKPFLTIDAKLTLTANQQVLWEEKDVYAGHSAHPYSSYQHEASLLSRDLEEAIEDTGRRLAATLIYQ